MVNKKDSQALVDYIDNQNIELSPCCIPSYKFRSTRQFDIFKKNHQNQKFYLFVYEDDFVNSGYCNYDFPDNFTIVKLDFKKSIARKRQYILEYMREQNISKYFVIDDDVDKVYFSSVPKVKSPDFSYSKYKNLNFAFKALQLMQEETNAALVGCAGVNTMQTYKFRDATPMSTPFELCMFDGVQYAQHPDIQFECDIVIHEDIDFAIKSAFAGLKPLVLGPMAVHTIKVPTSFDFDYIGYNLFKINLFLRYPEFISLQKTKTNTAIGYNANNVKPNGMFCKQLQHWNRIAEKIENPDKHFKYNHELYEVCKRNNTLERVDNIRKFMFNELN